MFLISPFVGRILDWHVKAGGGPYTGETDPGVVSVRSIYAYYKAHGVKTVVMGASFRNVGRDRGARRLRPADHLAGASRRTARKAEGELPRKLSPDAAAEAPAPPRLDEKAFRFALNEDAMATEKLAEGIRQFVKDLRSLRALVARRLDEAKAA